MGKVRGNQTLTGTWGEVWVDGELIFVLQKIEVRVEANREDVQIGFSVDSKITGLKGSGTLSIKKVTTRAKKAMGDLSAGKDVRSQLIAKLQDPDAIDGQIERWSIDNVWWNTIPVINWESGTAVQEDWEFGFTPSDLKNLDEIAG